jgi:hypothetical protein
MQKKEYPVILAALHRGPSSQRDLSTKFTAAVLFPSAMRGRSIFFMAGFVSSNTVSLFLFQKQQQLAIIRYDRVVIICLMEIVRRFHFL